VNDINVPHVSKCLFLLFADDIAVINDDIDFLQNVLDELLLWFSSQDLIINVRKTYFMIFSKPNDKSPVDLAKKLFCNGELIERVDCFKYLGVLVDSHLNFKEHARSVKNRVVGAIGSIVKMRRLLNLRMFATLLNSYVFSVIDYCLPIWGVDESALKNLQGRIDRLLQLFFQKLPKKRKKQVFLSDPIKVDDLHAWYENCNLLTCTERLEFYSLSYLFNILRLSNISMLKDMYVIKERARSTKLENMIEVKSHKSCMFAKSLAYRATKLWNDLPHFLRSPQCSFGYFKNCISYILIDKRFNPFV
jgi:reverse transcriptase-like protein